MNHLKHKHDKLKRFWIMLQCDKARGVRLLLICLASWCESCHYVIPKHARSWGCAGLSVLSKLSNAKSTGRSYKGNRLVFSPYLGFAMTAKPSHTDHFVFWKSPTLYQIWDCKLAIWESEWLHFIAYLYLQILSPKVHIRLCSSTVLGLGHYVGFLFVYLLKICFLFERFFFICLRFVFYFFIYERDFP